ncbi:MAG: cyclic dehypoxanthinyl futalosine synthase [Armatimonadota bacterium]
MNAISTSCGRTDLLTRAAAGERLSADDVVALLECRDLLALGRAADAVRWRRHPDSVVSYVVDRNINYTNVCVSGCRFCAFHRREGDPDAYVLSLEELGSKIEETLALGGTQVLLQGGLHPSLELAWYEDMLRYTKTHYGIHVHGFSPPEIVHIARRAELSLRDCIARLRDAGLDTIPGGGAEILSDGVRRQLSPHKCTKQEWLGVMRTAHALGLRTTATMMFGHIESSADIAEHLLAVRELQDETGGFTAFIPWTFQPANTALGGAQVGAVAYLKVLAVSRLALDNVANLQASWVTQGGPIAQVALRFGANDMGSTMIEENVVAAAGATYRLPREEMIRLIEDASFQARQRDCYYNLIRPTTTDSP